MNVKLEFLRFLKHSTNNSSYFLFETIAIKPLRIVLASLRVKGFSLKLMDRIKQALDGIILVEQPSFAVSHSLERSTFCKSDDWTATSLNLYGQDTKIFDAWKQKSTALLDQV